jgi:hypothetical protein
MDNLGKVTETELKRFVFIYSFDSFYFLINVEYLVNGDVWILLEELGETNIENLLLQPIQFCP